MGILRDFIEKAQKNKKKIILAEGTEPRILKATEMILKDNISDIVLLGSAEEIKKKASEIGTNVDNAEIVDPLKSLLFDDYAKQYYEMRKKKGVDLEKAKKMIGNPLYFGCMMVQNGYGDGMVAGAVNNTADLWRPAFQIIKTAPGISIASSTFIMIVPNCNYGSNGVFLFADCSVNPDPTAEELATIAISTVSTAKVLLGLDPKVAMLSFSTKGSAQHELVDKVVDATKRVQSIAPDILIDGELQADAAIIPSVASLKAPGSKVAGNANVLIFPDLQSGNISYKLVQRLANAQAIGPVSQGLNKPINDLSRGCSAKDIYNTVAITAVQAGMKY